MRTRPIALLIVLAGLCACRTTPAVDTAPEPKRYDAPYVTQPPVIDGRPDDAAWSAAPWSDAFIDIEGDVRPRPRFETRMKMIWDDDYLYVAARLEEPHVWGTLDTHDQIVFHDNDFEVFIDPDGDTAQYFEVEINALETIFDLFLVKSYRNGGPALHDWDMKGLKSAVAIDGTLNDPSDVDERWWVELAMPWKAFAISRKYESPPEPGNEWRINFSRVQWQHQIVDGAYEKVPDTREDNWVWTPQYAINMHLPEHWGYVRFTRE